MARVTVEDCLDKVDNRFDLILMASKRARQLEMSAVEPTVEWDNDKPTVVALREIAEGNVDATILQPVSKEAADESGVMTEEQMAAEFAKGDQKDDQKDD